MDALDLDTLVALERRGWDALSDGTGGTYYGDLMTDDALMVLVNGIVMDRATVVASLDQAPTWDHYELTDPRRVDLGADAAALAYRATAQRGGEPPFEALMTSVYRLVDGTPRLALYTQTTATH
ncbi:nuclear transport factor 2 family protein [Mariniluteicoccus endophyticus]